MLGTTGFSSTFKSTNGRKYTFYIEFYNVVTTYIANANIPIQLENIEEIEFSNEFNSLYLTGSVIYNDPVGALDRLLNHPYTFCKLFLAENEVKSDNDIKSEKFKEGTIIEHTFYISNIEILEREAENVKYKLNLISDFSFNCLLNVNYSNYNNEEPESILEIFKKCLLQCNLPVDTEKSFTEIQTDVKIKYITNGNDNLLTIMKFLFNKLYYYFDIDDSLKFVYYDYLNKIIKLIDIKDINKFELTSPVILSMFKGTSESMLNGGTETNFATVTKFPTIDVVKNTFLTHLVDYNFDENIIEYVDFGPALINKYLNKTNAPNDSYVQRFSEASLAYNENFDLVKNGSYWANDVNIYNNSINSILNNNSLILNVDADINRQVGNAIMVSIDRSLGYSSVEQMEDVKDQENLKKRYKSFEGLWVISKNRFIISPSRGLFRQNIVLVRNYNINYKLTK